MTRASSPCHICLTSRYILRKALHHLIPAGKPLGAARRPFLGGFVRAEVAAVFCQLRTAVYLDTTDLLENVGVRTDTFTEELHAALIRVAPTRSLAGPDNFAMQGVLLCDQRDFHVDEFAGSVLARRAAAQSAMADIA